MARFEASATSIITTATADTPIIALRAPATEIMKITEIGITLTAATASRLELVRANAVSTTPTGNIAGKNVVPAAPNSGSTIVTGWSGAPTIAAGTQLRRVSLPATIGAGVIWTWPADRPLLVGLGSAIAELLICNEVSVACSVFDLWVCWED